MINSTAFQENYSTTFCLRKRYISEKKCKYIHSYCAYFSSSMGGLYSELEETSWLRRMISYLYVKDKDFRRLNTETGRFVNDWKRTLKKNTYIDPVACCTCWFLLPVMLLQEVFPCLPLESRQHGVSRTCKLIIAQFKMKSISRRALCPFPFTETGSESKHHRSHSCKV